MLVRPQLLHIIKFITVMTSIKITLITFSRRKNKFHLRDIYAEFRGDISQGGIGGKGGRGGGRGKGGRVEMENHVAPNQRRKITQQFLKEISP